MSRRPARRSSSVIDCLDGPRAPVDCIPAYWVAVCLQKPVERTSAACCKRVGLSPQTGRGHVWRPQWRRFVRPRARASTQTPPRRVAPAAPGGRRAAGARARCDRSSDGRAPRRSRRGRGRCSASSALVACSMSCYAGRSAGMLLVIGDFPAPGRIAAAQHDERRDGATGEHEPRGSRPCLRGQAPARQLPGRRGSRAHAPPRCRRVPSSRPVPVARKSASAALIAAGSRAMSQATAPSSPSRRRLPAKLLELLARERTLDVVGALASRREQRAHAWRMPALGAAAPRERSIKCARKHALLRKHRQQQEPGPTRSQCIPARRRAQARPPRGQRAARRAGRKG